MADSDRALKELWFGKDLCMVLFGFTPVEQQEELNEISKLGRPVMLTGKKKIKKNTTKLKVRAKSKRSKAMKTKKKTTKKENKKEPMIREQPGWRMIRLKVAGSQFRQKNDSGESIYAPRFPSCQIKVITPFNPLWTRFDSG